MPATTASPVTTAPVTARAEVRGAQAAHSVSSANDGQ